MMVVAMSFSAISRKQKFCPTSRLSPSITLANMDMELGKESTERITIYKGEYCSSEERLHYIYIPTSLVKKETSLPGFFFVVQFGREIG